MNRRFVIKSFEFEPHLLCEDRMLRAVPATDSRVLVFSHYSAAELWLSQLPKQLRLFISEDHYAIEEALEDES